MTMAFELLQVSAIQRISAAKVVLDYVKTKQSQDWIPDFEPDMKEEYSCLINFLCEAGFIRKAEIPDNAFPYRITWKGLCFIDTANELEQISKNNTYYHESIQDFMIKLAALSFH